MIASALKEDEVSESSERGLRAATFVGAISIRVQRFCMQRCHEAWPCEEKIIYDPSSRTRILTEGESYLVGREMRAQSMGRQSLATSYATGAVQKITYHRRGCRCQVGPPSDQTHVQCCLRAVGSEMSQCLWSHHSPDAGCPWHPKIKKLFAGATIAKEHLPPVLCVLESRDSAWYSVAADFGMQVTSVIVVFLLKPLTRKSQLWVSG